MGSKSKPSGTTQTVQATEPWSGQKPYLDQVFLGAKELYDDYDPQLYPDATYAAKTQTQTDALDAMKNIPYNDTTAWDAETFSNDLLTGKYLGQDAGSVANNQFMNSNYGVGLQGSGTLNTLSGANQATNSPGWGALRDQAGTNLGTTNQGASYLNDFAKMGGTPDDRLAKLADLDPNANNVGNTLLQNAAQSRTSNPADGYLRDIAAGGPNQYAGINNLSNFAKDGAANPGQSALNSYSSGARLAAGNPYMDAVANSVKTRVQPQIQSQFINSGTLSSPEAARATAAGVASAIAPFAYGQYQQEEQNQIGAANSLNSQALQSRGLQQGAANDAANASIGVNTLRGNVGQGLGGMALQERGLQNTAAGNLANSITAGQGLQYGAANNYGNQALQARGQQQTAASQLSDAALQGGQLQQGAASTLGNQYLQGSGLQNQAASTLGSQALSGRELQQGAANNYTQGNNAQLTEMLRGLGLSSQTQDMQYKPWQNLYDVGATEQNLNQASIDDSAARWNYYQNLPYDELNQYANTIQGQYGGTSTRTDPIYTNRTSNALSGALGGASLGSMFGPWGTAIGGGIGGIGSLFG